VNTRKLAELRETMPDGTLPAYAWPGGYPIVYYTTDGLTVCAVCANDPDTSDPVADADIYYEGPPIVCDDKGELIQSAYGDPDEPEPEAPSWNGPPPPGAELTDESWNGGTIAARLRRLVDR
jgi:hypothetical protein